MNERFRTWIWFFPVLLLLGSCGCTKKITCPLGELRPVFEQCASAYQPVQWVKKPDFPYFDEIVYRYGYSHRANLHATLRIYSTRGTRVTTSIRIRLHGVRHHRREEQKILNSIENNLKRSHGH